MLRAERANRRITHPHASYTSDGKLLCNLCETLVKSEAQWQSHLHSTQHVLRSQRAQEVNEVRTDQPTQNAGKKRKAESVESPVPKRTDDRKRSRPAEEDEAGYAQKRAREESPAKDKAEEITAEAPAVSPNNNEATSKLQQQPQPAIAVNDDEFAAFERDLASASTQPTASALNTGATISAPAMSAEELAAQAREEQSAQRGKRDREIEEEREDAERAMEDEFEEMEGLEERVRKLRERREALRVVSPEVGVVGGMVDGVVVNGVGAEGSESDDDDEDDEWGFGGS